jgi:hypothetical protein
MGDKRSKSETWGDILVSWEWKRFSAVERLKKSRQTMRMMRWVESR